MPVYMIVEVIEVVDKEKYGEYIPISTGNRRAVWAGNI